MTDVLVTYFDRPGRANTEATLELARRRAEELDIRTILVASSTGSTGIRACQVFRDRRVVVVSVFTGFREPNVQRLTSENREAILDMGGVIHTASHAFTGVSRAVQVKLGTAGSDDIVRHTLFTFGQGMKVVCEIALMAADAGLVRTDHEVIAVAGTGGGADTAVVIRPATLRDMFDLRVREVICKPRL